MWFVGNSAIVENSLGISLHGNVGFTSVYMGMLCGCQDTVYTDIINSEELNN